MAKKKESKDVLENPEALAEQLTRSEEFVRRNKNYLLGGLLTIAAAVVGLYFYMSNKTTDNYNAQLEVYPAQYYFGQDSLDLAMNGGPGFPGFQEVQESYPGTDPANLAAFYQGVIQLKKGNFEAAISSLEQFTSDDLLVQARAYALTGDAYMELKDYDKAVELYTKAKEYKPNESYTPMYMMKLATAYEAKGAYADATLEYESLLEKYPDALEATEAKKYMARAAGMATQK